MFGYLANQISKNFFPSHHGHSVALIETYGIFAGAFIARPFGGLCFGTLGDKYGRKAALQLSMMLMFVATFVLGCLPNYNHIGIYAPLLLAVLRIFQGVSVGGQLVGSMLYLIGMYIYFCASLSVCLCVYDLFFCMFMWHAFEGVQRVQRSMRRVNMGRL